MFYTRHDMGLNWAKSLYINKKNFSCYRKLFVDRFSATLLLPLLAVVLRLAESLFSLGFRRNRCKILLQLSDNNCATLIVLLRAYRRCPLPELPVLVSDDVLFNDDVEDVAINFHFVYVLKRKVFPKE